MYPLAQYIFETSSILQKKDSSWDFVFIILMLLFFFPVMVVTDSATGGLGIVFYVFFVALIGWKALPGKLMYENKKRIFESEFEEIIDIYQKNRKKTPSQIHKSIQPKYFSLEDIKSICNHYEDLEIHKQITKTKKKTFKMKEIKTSLIELKKNEKVFFRSQTCWTKGDPEVNHQVSDYGHIYFTNLAIIFSGYNRSSRINFTRILEIEEYEDLISLNKTSGVNDNFSLSIESIKYCMLFYKNRLKVKSKK